MRFDELLTVPNALCSFRLVGSVVLLAVAWWGYNATAFGLAIALLISDWLDGKLAILLEQRSAFGAKLDSVADLSMYSCVVAAIAVLYPDIVREHAAWIAVAGASYVLTVAISYFKFRRWPSYHARSAKVSWLAAAIAIVAVFADWSDWPVRVALVLVTLANLEGIVITALLPEPDVNVPTFVHALRTRRSQNEPSPQVRPASPPQSHR